MKHKLNINYILAACAITLFALCLLSIWQPIHFDKEVAKREQAVKERLAKIRTAEEKYKLRHSTYTANWNLLTKEKLLDEAMQYIPGTNKRFDLTVSMIVGKNGKQIPLMECGATYEDYLEGLNDDGIQQLTDKANYAGLYPGLKIGDITTDNNNAGNW